MSDPADPPLVELRPTCLVVLPGLSWEEWVGAWESLDQTSRSLPWLIGDALLYAQQNFGEAWSQAVDAQYADQYGRYLRVSTLIPPIERRPPEIISWSSHRECASLSSAERAEIFDLAEANGWRSREVRDEVQRRKAARRGNGGPPLDELPMGEAPAPPAAPPAPNSTWNEPDDGDTFGDPQDIAGEAPPAPPQRAPEGEAPEAALIPYSVSAPAQGDAADHIRSLIAQIRRLAPDLPDDWRLEGLKVNGEESVVKLTRGAQLAIGQGPSLPCALVEAALSALLSDLGAG